MRNLTSKLWVKCAFVAFASQMVLFAVIHLFLDGAPVWVELLYHPFQWLFVNLLGEFWAYGLVLGVVAGVLAYSCAAGVLLAWVFRSRRVRTVS